jgi:hypothetical protein
VPRRPWHPTRAVRGGQSAWPPIAGQTVTFSAGGQVVCNAMTNADGVATCSGVVVISLGTVVATYAGAGIDQPATTTVPLL